jgi:hypothetical protein
MAQAITEVNNFEMLFNKGIKSFGFENVVNIISSFSNTYNLPIVSMGSGSGVIEYLAKKKNGKIDWICIDNSDTINFPPGANQYINKPLMNIDYNSCDQLIEATPSIVNNCILFLNWCLPNNSTYDFEAIIKLKPLAVLSIYEIFRGENGAAGGEMFFNWTKNNKDYHHKEEYNLYVDDNYFDNHSDVDFDYELLMYIRISWWQLNTLNDFDDLIVKNYPRLYYENSMTKCCIS